LSAKRARAPRKNAQPSKPDKRGRRIALFGGTFDPIHSGHLDVASAAQRRFHLDQVFFIPVSHPPHKRASEMLPFAHRFALVALACAGYPRFVPSLAEAAFNVRRGQVFYSVDTVRKFQKQFSGPDDRLYFLLGADAFLQIATWKKYKTLLGLCDFVIANRPGFRSEMLYQAIPPELLARPQDHAGPRGSKATVSVALRRTTVHLLDTVASQVSATDVRERLERGQSIRGLVPRGVEEYIKKQALYRVEALSR